MITETREVSQCEVHSDADDGYKIDCPNCNTEIIFACGQWWDSKCKCGHWSLSHLAVLDVEII